MSCRLAADVTEKRTPDQSKGKEDDRVCEWQKGSATICTDGGDQGNSPCGEEREIRIKIKKGDGCPRMVSPFPFCLDRVALICPGPGRHRPRSTVWNVLQQFVSNHFPDQRRGRGGWLSSGGGRHA